MEKLKLFLLMSVSLSLITCKKPTENIKIVLDTDIIKYTAMIHVTDGETGNAAPNNATITILGTAEPDIYELSGKKEIRLTQGMVTIGLRPSIVPTAEKPITITAEINAPGYNKASKQITFTANQLQQVADIPLVKIGSTTPPVTPPPPPIYNTVALTFTGTCPNRSDLQIRPSVYVYFKKTGSTAAFQYLGYMDKGNLSTNLLALNETYVFQIAYGGENYSITQKIEQANYNLSISMPAACQF